MKICHGFYGRKSIRIMENNKKLSPRKQRLLNDIIEICNENIDNSGFGVLQLANEVNISERQLYRILQDLSGLTPHKFMREIKLQTAREIIKEGKCRTITEVASSVGFERADYFSGLYHSRFGIYPKELY